ncbi:MAG TPA: response regulator transcription factor, partial [Roseiflexaceae bacterium]|nr:response regulator transcription factor [Roseiflexaceae bacterium]
MTSIRTQPMPTMPIQIIRVLLIEDHAVVRAGLRLLIESRQNLKVVGEAANHADALALAAREQPDIILLDLDLGAESGVELLPGLRSVAGQARVLVLTGVRDDQGHRLAIRRGARGLVLKEQAPEVLLKAITKVHAGEVWLERAMLASLLDELAVGETRPVNAEAARIAMLTEREREVIALVGEGLKNKQIGHRLSITETTVGHHLTSIFAKLGVESRLEMVLFAHRHNITKRAR